MKLLNVFTILGLLLLLLSGCASTKQLVPFPDQTKMIDDPSKARIYVLRPSPFVAGISMEVSDEWAQVGSTGARGYLCWERPPGETEIQSQAENLSRLSLTCEAGNVYYIGQYLRLGIATTRNQLILLSGSEGRKMLSKCKPPNVLISGR